MQDKHNEEKCTELKIKEQDVELEKQAKQHKYELEMQNKQYKHEIEMQHEQNEGKRLELEIQIKLQEQQKDKECFEMECLEHQEKVLTLQLMLKGESGKV